MSRFVTGQTVSTGMYVSLRHIDLRLVEGHETTLRGKPGATYLRLPLAMVVVAGPVVGGAFAVAFPLVIFLAFAQAMWQRLTSIRAHYAGDRVRWGAYVGVNRLALRTISQESAVLRGRPGTRYLRVPTWMLLAASPLIGLAFAVAFPMLLAYGLLSAFGTAAARAFQAQAPLAHARFAPATAFLSPKKAEETEATESEPALADLEAEVAARREDEQV